MADPFLFQDELPPLSFEPDEKALAQAKYLAALRGGLGLIDREPIGRAGQGAINTYLGAHEDARRQQLAQQQLMMQRMKMAEDIRKRQAVQNFLGGLTPQQRKQYGISEEAYQGMLAMQDPGMALEAMKPRTTKEGDVVTVGNQPFITRAKDGVTPLMVDGQEVGATPVVGYAELKAQQVAAAERAKTEAVNKADYFTKPVEVEIGGRKTKMTMAQYDQIIGRQPPAAQGATQPSGFSWKGNDNPTDIGKAYLQWQKDQQIANPAYPGLPPGYSPSAAEEARAKGAIDVTTAQEKAFAEQYAKDALAAVKAGREAPYTIGKLQLMKDYFGKVATGKAAPLTMEAKALSAYFFPDLAKKFTADLPFAQAAEGIAKEMALQLRTTGEGAGMPGAMSDADRDYLRSMLPSLGSDPRSIEKMVEMRIAIERRHQQVSQKVLKHRSSGGKIDDKFFADLQQWADENPLFQKERTTKAVDVTSDPDTAKYFVK